MNVDLEPEEIRAILDAVTVGPMTITDRSRSPYVAGITKLEEALGPVDSIVGRFLDGFRSGVEASRARRMAPRWEWLRPAIAAIDRTVKSDPFYTHNADALGAYVRDTYDALGLSIRDPETLYVLLVTASIVVELSSNGHGRGVVDVDTLETVAKISQSLAAAVIPYLPDEAKP